MEIILQTTKGENQLEENNLIEENIPYTKIDSSLWDGEIIVNYVIELSPYVITALTTLITQNIRSRKHIKVIVDGIEIQGLSGKETRKILETIYENRSE